MIIKNTKMKNRLRLLIVIGSFFFFQHLAIGQTNRTPDFLQQVGTLDSIYSNILKEYRKIYVQLPSTYDPTKNEKYPVVYILDGEVFLPTVNEV